MSKKTGKPYRLLSEAEWEYAARAGSQAARFWGAMADRACEFENGADTALERQKPEGWQDGWVLNACDDGQARTAPVGAFKPNAFGLHDMLGNLSEWVEDCYNKFYEGAPDGRSRLDDGRLSPARGPRRQLEQLSGGGSLGPPQWRPALASQHDRRFSRRPDAAVRPAHRTLVAHRLRQLRRCRRARQRSPGVGHIPPAECEQQYYQAQAAPAMVAGICRRTSDPPTLACPFRIMCMVSLRWTPLSGQFTGLRKLRSSPSY